jgi:hypothetical protein
MIPNDPYEFMTPDEYEHDYRRFCLEWFADTYGWRRWLLPKFWHFKITGRWW